MSNWKSIATVTHQRNTRMALNCTRRFSLTLVQLHVLLVIFVPTCFLAVVMTVPYGDEVNSLPGLNETLPWRHYSGYLNATGSKQLHYWFVQSSSPTPEVDPVVLWLNGGPGCSSMVGLLFEHGPFKIQKDGQTLKLNPYAWNQVANMLYLEAPAGVGYSFPAQSQYDDDLVSRDNYEALKSFFRKFPELRNNSLFIAGESYGGFYVPTLSELVVNSGEMNFQGFAVGNAVLDWEWLVTSTLYFFHNHGIIGEKEWEYLFQTCCVSPDTARCQLKSSDACSEKIEELERKLKEDRINYYNIYQTCEGKAATRMTQRQKSYLSAIFQFLQRILVPEDTGYPCFDSTYLEAYMNQDNVRRALNIPENLGEWTTCRGEVNDKYRRKKYQNVSSRFNTVLQARKRILVYNGDVDALVSYLSNQWFIDDLNVQELRAYSPWNTIDGNGKKQNAGYFRRYENVDFVTIKGAGHKAPMDKPAQALKMFRSFITNTPLSTDSINSQ